MKHTFAPATTSALIAGLLLTACGGGGGSTTTSTTTTETTTAFPNGLAVTSPVSMADGSLTLAMSSSPSLWRRLSDAVYALRQGDFSPITMAANRISPISDAWAASAHAPAYIKAANRINALLSGTATARTGLGFDANKFLSYSSNASCYGPVISYQEHPDGTPGNSGTLPSGDVGMWATTDTSTSHACAPAQLDARMSSVTERTNTALMTLASMINVASAAGKSLPSAGASLNLTTDMNSTFSAAGLTFTTATISQSSAGVWSYLVQFSFTDTSSLAHNAEIKMTHTPGASRAQYDGLLTYAVTRGTSNMLNCPSSSGGTVDVGTLKYTRTSTTAANLVHREGNYCGTGTASNLANSVAAFSGDGQLNPSNKWDGSTGWGNNFNRFGAEYDPTTSKGKYIFAWQAGYGDGNSRVFNIGLNYNTSTEKRDGEAYYGYGADIPSSDGQLQGFICNWAGPGNSHTLRNYFQRQHITYNDTTGRWEPTNNAASSSNITYAPTNSCSYAGGTTFIYDKNGNASLADDTAGSVTTLDLADTTYGATTYASVALAVQGRGMTMPSSGF